MKNPAARKFEVCRAVPVPNNFSGNFPSLIKMIRGSNDKTMSNRCKMSRNHGKGKHKKPEFWKGIAAGLEKECFTTRISVETKMVGTVQYKYQAICISQAGLGLDSKKIQ